MRRLLLVCLPFVLCGALPAEEPDGFFSERELALVDDALALLNMTREDAGFDKLVLEDDWRLPVVDRTLSRPLEAADVAWDWARRARGEPAAILDGAREVLGLEAGAGGEAWTLVDRITAGLDAGEKERLRRAAYALLIDDETHDDLIPKPEEELKPEEFLALAAKVDRGVCLDAARALLAALPGLVADPPDWVVVAGDGDDFHDLARKPHVVLIDLGGDDRYLAPARATPEHPIAVVIDLGGNDTYGAGESLSAGAGLFGVGILWDRGDGRDVYRGGHLSQGTGLFGVGVLIDEGGDDLYEVRDVGQGAGAFGVGLLLDRGEGNDRFHADLFGQGFAYVGGFGLLHNESGQEVYEAGGEHLHYPLFNDRYQSLSQGFSIGMRPHASGGVGLLVDDAGNDRYACDIYGQGASYWFAYGALVDSDGNDTYNLGQYGQGGGIHLAAGCLLDLKGQDLYYNMHGVGTGGAHDFAVGLLVDREGDDYYAGSGGTMGGALTNSFALLLDGAGDDGYSAVKVRHAVGGGRSARGMGSIGLFIDASGKDLHGTREREGTAWTKETYGAGIDLADPPPPAVAPPKRPQLSPEEIGEKLREADGDLEKLWEIARAWAVGEMADVVPEARRRLIALGDPAFGRALERVGTGNGLELRAVQEVLKAFGERSVPPLVAMLRDEDRRRRAGAAVLLADLQARDAAGAIVALLEDDKTKLGALDALARLGVHGTWESVAPILTDGKERVRVAALRCLQSLDAREAVGLVAGRLSRTEIFTVRFAAEDVLVGFADAARPILVDLARQGKDVTVRRHAIRALGRTAPAEAYDLLAELAGHEDWRIRYDVAGALAAYAPARDLLREWHEHEQQPYVRARLDEGIRSE